MNGRTAEDNRIPVNGTAGTNGAGNGHAPQPAANLGAPTEWRSGQQIAEVQVPKSEWLSEVRDRPRDPSGTTLRQFNTPVRVDEIAVAAMTLAEDLHAATQNMPESVELRRFRRELDQAATTFRDLASKLEVTAGKLVRLAANEGQACGVGWGVCPEHGLTLMNIGDAVTCHVLGCGRENVGEVERCEHPVGYRVVDAAGPSLLTCAGHAIACRLYFDNPVITATADSMELF
ncbi:hypothetical protein [Kribbella sp. NPDC004536]|uniref:hypothetical protein n=1 Tax=Kribbella sp. NPDC004536 TaxID=3364106 RepID=UPI0036AF3285